MINFTVNDSMLDVFTLGDVNKYFIAMSTMKEGRDLITYTYRGKVRQDIMREGSGWLDINRLRNPIV